ncbi:hypothetical protein [Vibrio owensii]|uniref:hypothetical protein n=1 Tax=Vibrio harveyi group TaxID=717610 RepID=UPI003CC5B9E1
MCKELKTFNPDKIYFYIPGKECQQNKINKGTFVVNSRNKHQLKFKKENPEQTLFALALSLASSYTTDSVFDGLKYISEVLNKHRDPEVREVNGSLEIFKDEIGCTKTLEFVSSGEINTACSEFGSVSYRLPKTAKESFPVYAAVFCISYFGYENTREIVASAFRLLRG